MWVQELRHVAGIRIRADVEKIFFSVRHPRLLPLKRLMRVIPTITFLFLQWVRENFPGPLWVYSVTLLAPTPIESRRFCTDRPFELITSGVQKPWFRLKLHLVRPCHVLWYFGVVPRHVLQFTTVTRTCWWACVLFQVQGWVRLTRVFPFLRNLSTATDRSISQRSY